jgi:hypothetical protein
MLQAACAKNDAGGLAVVDEIAHRVYLAGRG